MRTLSAWMLLVFLSLGSLAQDRDAPLSTPYDSLQDQQLRRLERSLGQGLAITGDKVSEASLRTDSLKQDLEMMAERLDLLERRNSMLQDSIASLNTRMEQTGNNVLRYRKRLHRTLWLAGTGMLILTLSLCVTIWLHSLKNRRMMEKLGKRFARLKAAIKAQRKWTLKATRKEVRRGLRSRKRRKR